jgi:hypothetical protein
VQAAIHNMGDGYAGFLRVVATAWLPLEGEDFNTVLGTFRPRVDAVQEEPDGQEVLDVFETLEFEDPAGFIVEDYEPPPHSSGTMVRGGIDIIPGHCKSLPSFLVFCFKLFELKSKMRIPHNNGCEHFCICSNKNKNWTL